MPVKSHCFAKSSNCWEVHCLALSEIRVCAVPWTETCLFSLEITADDVRSRRWLMTNHPEYESTSTWYCSPRHSKISVATVDQGRLWTGWEMSGYFCWWDLVLLHTTHDSNSLVMSCDIDGQKIMLQGLRLVVSTPGWPLFIIFMYSLCSDWGMIALWLFITIPSSTVSSSLYG